MKDLNWYAFYYNWNKQKLDRTNVIHNDLIESVKKGIKKHYSYEQIKDLVKSNLMWHYWCKSEWEVLVYDLMARDENKGEKIDIYYQLKPNLDRITEYLISNLTPKSRKKKDDSVSKN